MMNLYPPQDAEKWVTDNPYFRLVTTLLGISVTDTWKLASYHKLLTRHRITHHIIQWYISKAASPVCK